MSVLRCWDKQELLGQRIRGWFPHALVVCAVVFPVNAESKGVVGGLCRIADYGQLGTELRSMRIIGWSGSTSRALTKDLL